MYAIRSYYGDRQPEDGASGQDDLCPQALAILQYDSDGWQPQNEPVDYVEDYPELRIHQIIRENGIEPRGAPMHHHGEKQAVGIGIYPRN